MTSAQSISPFRRQTWQEGALVEIPLAEGHKAYAQLGRFPVAGFFDKAPGARPALEDLLQLPLLFKLWVEQQVVTRGRWLKIGKAELRPDIAREDAFWKQDPITGRLALCHSRFANWERPARLSECQGLERAAVWGASHVEARLNAHFFGSKDPWSAALAIDLARVPADQRDA